MSGRSHLWPVITLHTLGFGALAALALTGGTGGLAAAGLGLTAYTLGLRHGFDADHLAATDTAVRKLTARDQPAAGVGVWFALGHSTVVFAMACLVAAGAAITTVLVDDDSTANAVLGAIGVTVSGLFLLTLGALNAISTGRLYKAWNTHRAGQNPAPDIDDILDRRGILHRLLRPLVERVHRPGHMYPIGLLFGLGFDTATSVALLVMTGAGIATGTPWYVVLTLPVLFAAGMTLVDGANSTFMTRAYTKADTKLVYSLVVTALSAALALLIGILQISTLATEVLGATDPVTTWLAGVDTAWIGPATIVVFVVAYAAINVQPRRTPQLDNTA